MKHHIVYSLSFFLVLLVGCNNNNELVDGLSEPTFTYFSFLKEDNPCLSSDIIIDFSNYSENDTIELFVPHLITDSLVARFDGSYDRVLAKGVVQVSGESSNDFNEIIEYVLYNSDGERCSYYFSITGYNGLPVLYIETENLKPIDSKEDYITAQMRMINTPKDGILEAVCDIRGRGNSTWLLEKKPYRIKFKEKRKFLGEKYANAKNWTLLANHTDKSLIRNALTSELGHICGIDFNPAAVFVDLVLNGTYMGSYQISDQVEVRKKRVDIASQGKETEDGFISGGYLMEITVKKAIEVYESDKPWFATDLKGIGVLVKYPDDDDYNDHQIAYIKNFINKFEYSLYNVDFEDEEASYHNYVDVESLINWYICTEFSANPDGLYSTYVYKNRDNDHLFFGPLWDNDIAWNNCFRKGDFTNKLCRIDGYELGGGKRMVSKDGE